MSLSCEDEPTFAENVPTSELNISSPKLFLVSEIDIVSLDVSLIYELDIAVLTSSAILSTAAASNDIMVIAMIKTIFSIQ